MPQGIRGTSYGTPFGLGTRGFGTAMVFLFFVALITSSRED